MRGGGDHRLGGLLLRGMAAARQEAGLDRDAHEGLECIDLDAREELVLGTLNGEYRAADLSDVLLDAPVARFLSAPRIDEPAKQLIGLASVVTGEPNLEITVLKVGDLIGNACNRPLLTEEMGCNRDHPADEIGEGAREGQRDRGAVGMSYQDRAPDMHRLQDLRQQFQASSSR